MKKVSFTTQPGDHVTILRNGLAVYSCHETSGHRIDLFVPDYETAYDFDSAKNKVGRARISSKLDTVSQHPKSTIPRTSP
jgi:hypothetical protein